MIRSNQGGFVDSAGQRLFKHPDRFDTVRISDVTVVPAVTAQEFVDCQRHAISYLRAHQVVAKDSNAITFGFHGQDLALADRPREAESAARLQGFLQFADKDSGRRKAFTFN